MLKLLGAVCIFGAAGWAWRRGKAERKRELDTLADLMALLGRMDSEIRLRRTSLPRLLESLGHGRTPAVAAFCAAAAGAMNRGEPLAEAWRAASGALPLGPEDRSAFLALGESLQGDEEQVCKAISLAARFLARSLEEARARRRETERREAALWLSAGALLVILLI